jgi:RNA polymerase sigma-70 factor (ECF subfamily)
VVLANGPELLGLVARAQKGDRAAFERIVQGTARMVHAQVVLMVKDRQKAEDITQEAYVAAWNGIGGWKAGEGGNGGEGFIAWLQKVARNASLDAIKREQRITRGGGGGHGGLAGSGGFAGDVADLADEGNEGETGPAAAAEGNEARERAVAMLEELPEEYRRVLSMRYLAGAEYAVIREQLGLTDGALRGLLHRGMALLRERMTRSREMK